MFVVYSVMNYAIEKNIELDITLYDITQCFDSMWYQETMNDMWSVGVNDDKFALMARMNKKVNITIKTAVGDTEQFMLKEIEQQGTCNGPIKCSVQIDSIGRDSYRDNNYLFPYKNAVLLPPLAMIDNIISFAVYGPKSITVNSMINAKIEMKKWSLVLQSVTTYILEEIRNHV